MKKPAVAGFFIVSPSVIGSEGMPRNDEHYSTGVSTMTCTMRQ
jgi:hypothetical protein